MMSRLSGYFHVKIASGKNYIYLQFFFFFLFYFYLLKSTEVALPKNMPRQLPGDEGVEVLRLWPL